MSNSRTCQWYLHI